MYIWTQTQLKEMVQSTQFHNLIKKISYLANPVQILIIQTSVIIFQKQL